MKNDTKTTLKTKARPPRAGIATPAKAKPKSVIHAVKVKPVTPATKPSNRSKMEQMGIDGVCDRLKAGKTLTSIAEDMELASIGTLLDWLSSDPERSARAREARSAAAAMYDEQAQAGIEAALDPFELAKAKEMAQHLRWRASKVNPKDYGDKVQVDATVQTRTVPDAVLLTRLRALGVNLPSIQAIAPGIDNE